MAPSQPSELTLISDEPVAALADDRLRWRRQRVLPQDKRWKSNSTGEEGRRQIHEPIIQKAVAGAVRKAGADADLCAGVLCREFAIHRCYEESI